MSCQLYAPAALPPGKDPVPIVKEVRESPGPVWTSGENLAPTPGFDPRTVQSVASHCNYWAIRLPGYSCLSVQKYSCLSVQKYSCLSVQKYSCLSVQKYSCLSVQKYSCLSVQK
jgi:hypothetical protein